MNIRKDAMKIAHRMLDAVIEQGTFKFSYTSEYEMFSDNFGLSDKHCQLCLEYLEYLGCIQYETDDQEKFKILPQIINCIEDEKSR